MLQQEELGISSSINQSYVIFLFSESLNNAKSKPTKDYSLYHFFLGP